MTQMLTLNVEYDELMARADEIEAPIPGLPTDNPQAPCCQLAMVIAAAEQLGLSADNMRLYLRTGIEREWPKLADSLRQAAKAYEEVDEDAAAAMNNGTSVSAVVPRVVDPDLAAVVLGSTQAVSDFPAGYEDLKQRCWELEATDRGAAFDHFADAWTTYREALLQATWRFRPFHSFQGDAAYALEMTMDKQRQWLIQMADLCLNMLNQARTVASTQRWALPQHVLWYGEKLIDYAYLVEFEAVYVQYPEYRGEYNKYYAEWQQISDAVMDDYRTKASLPLSPINPQAPPYVQGGTGSNPADGLPSIDDPSGSLPWDQLPSRPGGNYGAPSTGMPATPSTPMPADVPTDTPVGVPSAPPPGAGIKPASFGGGGASPPSLPLPPMTDVSAGVAASTPGAGAPGPGRGIPGLGGALGPGTGGGMGGGMPMGAGAGQGQGANKGKRAQQDQEELYVESRPWTEGVIGNRPRKASADK